MKEFSNLELMKSTKAALLQAVEDNVNYCDPQFGDIFHRIALATDDVITRFSCQGHYQIKVRNKITEEFLIIDPDDFTDDHEYIHEIDSFPYVYFLCTPKGKLLIEKMFYYAIELTASLGHPTYIHDLTISHYSEKDCNPLEKTYRMDWKGVHLNTLGISDYYEFFVDIFIKAAEKIILKNH